MLRNAAFNIADRVIMVISRLLSAILIARLLGPEGYGIFQVALTASIIAATLADFGFGIANNYLASRFPQARPKLLGNTLVFIGGAGTVCAFLSAIAIVIFRNHAFHELPESYLWLIPLSIPIQAVQISLIGLVYGANKFKEKVIGTSLHYGLFLGATIALALLGRLTTNSLMSIWITGLSVSSLYWIGMLIRSGLGGPKWDKVSLLKEQFSYGRNSYIYNTAHMLNFRLDMILVAYFLKAEYVGWYALATSISEALLYLPKALSNVVLTETAKELKDNIKVNHHLVYKGMIIIMGVAIVGIAILAPVMIPMVFSDSFMPSIAPLLILLPGTLAMGLGIIASYHLFGLGKPFQPSIAALVATAATVTLDILLIPLLGIQGAAIASTLSYTSFSAICLYAVLGEIRVKAKSLLIPTKRDVKALFTITRRV